jgi:hypothetical protein
MSVDQTNHERNSTPERELHSLLSRWAAIEPARCRQRDETRFDVQYAGHWITVTDQPSSHGAIIVAVFEGCQAHRLHCAIDYTPRYEDHPATVEVGCVPRMFRWDEGDEVVFSIPALLLTEYLERLKG